MEKIPEKIMEQLRTDAEFHEAAMKALRSGEMPPGEFDDEVYENLLAEREAKRLVLRILEEHDRLPAASPVTDMGVWQQRSHGRIVSEVEVASGRVEFASEWPLSPDEADQLAVDLIAAAEQAREEKPDGA